MTRPDEDIWARGMMWGGALVLISARVIDSLAGIEHEALWFLIGMFFVLLGLVSLPKHPEHYHVFGDEGDSPSDIPQR